MVTVADEPTAATFAFDPSSVTETGDPHALWEVARRECPIFFNERLGAWIVTRYEDAQGVLRDPRRFVSRDSFDPAIPLPPEVEAILADGWENYIVVNVDRPDHTPLRKAINRVLTRSAVEETTPIIRRIANELVDGFAARGRVDVATDFARLFPALVVGEILGIPKAEVPGMLRWGHDFQTILAGAAPTEELARAAQGLVEYQQYFVRAIESRRTDPLDDFVSRIVSEFDGDAALDLSIEQIANIPLALFTAGHNTTSAAICNGLFLVLQHPASVTALRDSPQLAERAAEEALRCEPPFPLVRRTVTEDVVVGGTSIPKGSTIMLAIASVNRDECEFADPAVFDLHRANADEHLTFGFGAHFCPGGPLARREVTIALEVLLERLTNIRLVAYERSKSFLARGFTQLEIEWDT